MPRGDGTGPTGAGPLTGRGMGYCAGRIPVGYPNYGFGRGRGYGYGLGRGAQPFYNIQNRQVGVSTEDERNFLKNRLSALEDEVKNIRSILEPSKSER